MPHAMRQYIILSVSLVLYFLSPFSVAAAGPLNQNPDRIKHPPLSFDPPKPERISWKNGMSIYLLTERELPLVNLSAVVRSGSIYDPQGKEGLAELTGAVMRSGGSRRMTSSEINKALDFTGASLEVAVGKDSTTLSLSVLKKDIDAALKIFSGIIKEPAFEEKQLDLAKRLRIAGLKRTLDDPDRLAFREFNRLIYRDNPRGRLAGINSIEGIVREDLVSLHREYFQPANTIIAISGDIGKDEAIKKLEDNLGDWSSSTSEPPRKIPVPAPRQPGAIYFIEKDTPQSIIIIGWIAPKKTGVGYYPFILADFLLGSGGFRSRIFSEIRSAHGLAYSTGSVYRARSDYGIFFAYSMTKAESTTKALSLLKTIIDDFKKNPLTPKELTWAQTSINNGFIFSFLSADQIARNHLMLEYDGLPDDFYLAYQSRVQKVTPGEVQAIARDYLFWEEAVILVVGREKDFEGQLGDFGQVKRITATVE
ncbi:MAG: pitrilysin family protein [Smithellaceae bacterium]|nr:pitrilysin family protein [Smithellaceae bacterium]